MWDTKRGRTSTHGQKDRRLGDKATVSGLSGRIRHSRKDTQPSIPVRINLDILLFLVNWTNAVSND